MASKFFDTPPNKKCDLGSIPFESNFFFFFFYCWINRKLKVTKWQLPLPAFWAITSWNLATIPVMATWRCHVQEFCLSLS